MKETGHLLKATFTAWQADKAPRLGASLAFYALFSLAPLLVVAAGILGLLLRAADAQATLIHIVNKFVGGTSGTLITGLISHSATTSQGSWAIAIGLVTTLFGALGIFLQLKDALDTIWNKYPKKSSWIEKAGEYGRSFLILLGISALLLFSLTLGLVISPLAHSLDIPEIPLRLAETVLAMALGATVLAVLYKILPEEPVTWREVVKPSLITALTLIAGRSLLTLYLTHSAIASPYGAAGGLAILLLWLYYSAQIFLFGAEYTKIKRTA